MARCNLVSKFVNTQKADYCTTFVHLPDTSTASTVQRGQTIVRPLSPGLYAKSTIVLEIPLLKKNPELKLLQSCAIYHNYKTLFFKYVFHFNCRNNYMYYNKLCPRCIQQTVVDKFGLPSLSSVAFLRQYGIRKIY